jgi:hypothetical protein
MRVYAAGFKLCLADEGDVTACVPVEYLLRQFLAAKWQRYIDLDITRGNAVRLK